VPKLEITVKDFAGAFISLNGNQTLNVSKNRLRKFAVSIGLPIHAAATSSSQHAVMFAAYKAQAIKCTVDFSKPSLGHFAEYVHLDPSEKVNLSYWTGMTLAALVADEVLGISCLVHAAALGGPKIKKTDPKSKSLADLVGQDPKRRWHVVEAKARQSDPSDKDKLKWKKQAITIKEINGVKPSTASYAFTKVTPIYTVALVDPPENDQDGVGLEFEPDAVLRGYYVPLVEFLTQQQAQTSVVQGRRIVSRMVAFDSVDLEYVYLGMTDDALRSVRSGELPSIVQGVEFDNGYIGSDGVVISTSKTPNLE
jgi:hypothetical protein